MEQLDCPGEKKGCSTFDIFPNSFLLTPFSHPLRQRDYFFSLRIHCSTFLTYASSRTSPPLYPPLSLPR